MNANGTLWLDVILEGGLGSRKSFQIVLNHRVSSLGNFGRDNGRP